MVKVFVSTASGMTKCNDARLAAEIVANSVEDFITDISTIDGVLGIHYSHLHPFIVLRVRDRGFVIPQYILDLYQVDKKEKEEQADE